MYPNAKRLLSVSFLMVFSDVSWLLMILTVMFSHIMYNSSTYHYLKKNKQNTKEPTAQAAQQRSYELFVIKYTFYIQSGYFLVKFTRITSRLIKTKDK